MAPTDGAVCRGKIYSGGRVTVRDDIAPYPF
jgi:hypothetical protein